MGYYRSSAIASHHGYRASHQQQLCSMIAHRIIAPHRIASHRVPHCTSCHQRPASTLRDVHSPSFRERIFICPHYSFEKQRSSEKVTSRSQDHLARLRFEIPSSSLVASSSSVHFLLAVPCICPENGYSLAERLRQSSAAEHDVVDYYYYYDVLPKTRASTRSILPAPPRRHLVCQSQARPVRGRLVLARTY